MSVPEHQVWYFQDLTSSDDLKAERARNLQEMGIPPIDRQEQLVPAEDD